MILYIDCIGGISGDMFLGALLDIGVPRKTVVDAISRLKIENWKITVSREKRGVIQGARVKVASPGHHHSRSYADVKKMIERSSLSDGVKKRSLSIFFELASAEAKVHGEPINEVHFHEVGAVDSIVDIVGASAGLEYLKIDNAVCSPVPLGKGVILCTHGPLPLPAPAALSLLQGLESYGVDVIGETCTPTGAAILKATVSSSGIMPPMKVLKVGYGIGAADWPDRPNALRLIVGEENAGIGRDRVVVVEANVDDMTPQDFEPMMEAAFEAGALDVALISAQMKKNRPGILIKALCGENDAGAVMNSILANSSTIGVRWHIENRMILKRREMRIKTRYGIIKAKESIPPGGKVRIIPEYDDLKKIARLNGISMFEARREFWKALESKDERIE